jgi:hypothetical protein
VRPAEWSSTLARSTDPQSVGEHINLIGDYVCASGNQVTKNPDGFRPFRPPSEPARVVVSVHDLPAHATKKYRSFVGAELVERTTP